MSEIKNKFYIKMLVVLTGIFLSGCIDNNNSKLTEKYYFDLKKYFKDQAEKFEIKNISAEKILVNDKDTQQVVINNVDWEVEFAPFINSDINKPALRDSYKIDSIYDQKNLSIIKYLSLDEKQSVSQIQIHFRNDIISHVFIESSTSNYVYNSAQVLSFIPDKGYTIEGEQDIVIGSDMHYRIDVNFIK